MPTYEFKCPDGSIIERVFKMSEVPASIPAPGGGEAVRIISGGADLIFKGSGFYITDYGKDGKKDQREKTEKAAKKEGSEIADSSSPSSDSSAKADKPEKTEKPAAEKTAKPESKTETKSDRKPPPSGAAA